MFFTSLYIRLKQIFEYLTYPSKYYSKKYAKKYVQEYVDMQNISVDDIC